MSNLLFLFFSIVAFSTFDNVSIIIINGFDWRVWRRGRKTRQRRHRKQIQSNSCQWLCVHEFLPDGVGDEKSKTKWKRSILIVSFVRNVSAIARQSVSVSVCVCASVMWSTMEHANIRLYARQAACIALVWLIAVSTNLNERARLPSGGVVLVMWSFCTQIHLLQHLYLFRKEKHTISVFLSVLCV